MSLAPSSADGLGDHERAILDFEASLSGRARARASDIRERFGISSTRYHQQLNALLETEAALRYDPLLVRRLQRIRAGQAAW